ncbi:MAG: VapC toxin family PIN domain ribonuclease [Microbacterium sp.]|nr:MAG: VapC toxin family PIN domain ribonuclease [Microbacterium sp.]
MTHVLDASALLAYLHDEPGADDVEDALVAGAVVGAANWSEVLQKVRVRGGDTRLAVALLDSFDLAVIPVTREDAEAAAALWQAGRGLSLADRLCLALGERLKADVFTADRAWGSGPGIRQLRGGNDGA